MAKKNIELFLLPVENDEQRREIYEIIDNNDITEAVDKSVRVLSLYLEEAKEKFYSIRSTLNPDSYRSKLSQLIHEGVHNWKSQFLSTRTSPVQLVSGSVFKVEVVGTLTFTFEYSPDIQRVFDRDKSLYCVPARTFNGTDDIVKAISIANNILLKKSNFPIHRLKD